jgi:hypothetical protein
MYRLMLLAAVTAAVVGATSFAADEKKADAEGFVQLFNGKDLTGWKTHPDDKAKWEVVDGVIVGTGPAGHLYSDRGDYENFTYRIEAKISDSGNSGQYFRTKYQRGFPPGYEAQINSTGGDAIKTGSIAALYRLSRKREVAPGMVSDALKRWGFSADKPNPART